jgi:hypothetical protein
MLGCGLEGGRNSRIRTIVQVFCTVTSKRIEEKYTLCRLFYYLKVWLVSAEKLYPLALVSQLPCESALKVPMFEIFNRSDFHNFYTIKSLWEGDFVVKLTI